MPKQEPERREELLERSQQLLALYRQAREVSQEVRRTAAEAVERSQALLDQIARQGKGAPSRSGLA
jgi:hypothetical protein